MRGTASDAQRKKPIEVGGDDRRPFRKRNFPDKANALDARIVDEDVDPVRPRVDRLERFSDAGRISDIGLEIDNAGARPGGRQLVEGEHPCAVREQPLGDCIAHPARGTGDDGDAASKGAGHWHSRSSSASVNTSASPR
jgi:hypothetical protein